MSGNVDRRGYDISINSRNYRFRRGDQIVGLRTQVARTQVELQEITGLRQGGRLQSRADVRPFMQTDWSGGSRWERPMLTNDTDNVYVSASNIAAWRRPGFLEPLNLVHENSNSNVYHGPLGSSGSKVVAVGTTTIDSGLLQDVYEWDDATEDWVRISGINIGLDIFVKSMVYDVANSRWYYFGADSVSTLIGGFNIGGTFYAGGSNVGDTTTTSRGELLYHDGDVFFYDEKALYRVYDNGGTYSEEVVAADGQGFSYSGGMVSAYRRLAVSTTEGIYYVKNVLGDGQPQPWVYRVEKDSTGTYISTPIATLPRGVAAFDVAWHMGSLLIAATDEYGRLHSVPFTSGISALVFHVTGGSLGLIGSPLGNIETLDDTVGWFLGSEVAGAWLGGYKGIWYYDAIRGGLHPAYTYDKVSYTAPFRWMVKEKDADGDEILLFTGASADIWAKGPGAVEYDTVSSFGDDQDTYSLESAYFDFGLPFENKTITQVNVDTEQLSVNEQWTVFVEADDSGSWTQVAAHTNADYQSYTLSSPITGKRFRYKVCYETKAGSTRAGAFRGVKFDAISGEAVKVWVVELDGTEYDNLENEVTDPEDMYDDLLSLSETMTGVTFTRFKPNSGTEASYTVRVARVEFEEDNEGEFYASVVLVEV